MASKYDSFDWGLKHKIQIACSSPRELFLLDEIHVLK